MPDHEYVVLSKPPEGVSAQEHNDWYDRHMREVDPVTDTVLAEAAHG